jgi:hypothetical protein
MCSILCFTPPAEELHFWLRDIQFHWHIVRSVEGLKLQKCMSAVIWTWLGIQTHVSIHHHQVSPRSYIFVMHVVCHQEKPLSTLDSFENLLYRGLSDCLKIVSIFEASILSSVCCKERIKCCSCKSSPQCRHALVFPGWLRPLSPSDPAQMRHDK